MCPGMFGCGRVVRALLLVAMGCGLSFESGLAESPKPAPAFTLRPGDVFVNAPVGVSKQAQVSSTVSHWSPILGVSKPIPPPAVPTRTFYAAAVGVHRGAAVNGLTPNRVEIGQNNQIVVVSGSGLQSATSVALEPLTDTQVAGFSVNGTGDALSVSVNISATAAAGLRRLVLRDASGRLLANLSPNANVILLAANAPRVDSVTPSLLPRGRVHELVVRGTNLRGLPIAGRFSEQPRISIVPDDGIIIGSTIIATDDGTAVRFSVDITSNAPAIARVVQVITESAVSSVTANPANTIFVVDGDVRPIAPLVSPLVGIEKLVSTSTSRSAYSSMVGVSRGPVITALVPPSAALGATTRLRVEGSSLAAVTALLLLPDTDIAIVPGSLVVLPTSVQVDIAVAANASLQSRRVTLSGPGFSISSVQLLEIRAQPPEVTGLTPNFLLRDGSSQTIEIQGRQLLQTTAVRIIPDTRLIIEQYQALSPTHATVRLRTDGIAAEGPRVLQVEGSNGTSSATATANNTLFVVDRNNIVTPLISPVIGVVRPVVVVPPPLGLFARALGVVRGGVVTSVQPTSAPKGSTTRLTLRGAGLSSANSLVAVPANGVIVQNLTATADGSRVDLDLAVAADAELGELRLVLQAQGRPFDFAPPSIALVRITASQTAGPVTNPDTYEARANDVLNVNLAQGVLVNDVNPLGTPMLAVLRRLPSHGALNLSSNGSFVYTPNPDFKGADRFEYSAVSGPLVGASAVVSITVEEPNDALDDAYSTPDNLPLVVGAASGILANDVILDGPVTISLQSSAQRGVLALNPDGSFRYTPNGMAGIERIRYRLLKNGVSSLPAELVITVVDVNEAPLAVNDSYSVDRGATLTRAAPGVLANDRDPDGSILTARLVSPPNVGALTLNASGGFSYTPPASYVGQVTFDYEAVDPQGLAHQARVTVTVNDNLAPQPDAYQFNEGEVLFVVAANGLLANDSVIANGPLQIILAQEPNFGVVQLANDGSFVFRPDTPDRFGTATFQYRLRDSSVTSIAVPVTITVVAVNDPPTTAPDSYLSDENAQLDVPAPGVLANDRDIENGALRAELASSPLRGAVQMRADGSFSYIPQVNFRGSDTFSYRAIDPQAGASEATVNVLVTQPPTATNDVYLVDINTRLDVLNPDLGILANDHDAPEDDELTATLSDEPNHGALILQADGTFRYTPDAGYSGLDTFGYQVSDTRSISNVGTVTLAVGITSLPRAFPDRYTLNEDQELVVSAVDGVLSNDLDADTPRANLRPSVVGISEAGIVAGSLVLASDGGFRVRMGPNFSGQTFFVYQVFDGTSVSNAAIVRLEVTPVNDGVVAVDDRYGVLRNTVFRSGAFNSISRNDRYDADFPVNFSIATPAQFGTVTINIANGLFEYTPSQDFAGTDTFTYRVSQVSTGISATAVVTLRTNGPPLAGPDSYTLAEDSSRIVTPSILANDSDPDGDVIALSDLTMLGGYVEMRVNDRLNPTISTATARGDFYGTSTFNYWVDDGTNVSSGLITYSVTPVPDDPRSQPDNYLTQRDTPLIVNSPAAGLLRNDYDPDTRENAGSPPWNAATGLDLLALRAELLTAPGNGTLTLSEIGTFSYTPNTGFSGLDRFTYRTIDGTARQSATTTVEIRVNSPAQAVDDAFVLNEDVALVVAATQGLLINDTDIDGDVLLARFQPNGCAPCNGRVIVRDNGSFTYTPTADFHGQDEFFYLVNDPFSGTDVGRVGIVVLPINDAPRTEPDTYRTREDEVLIASQTLGILRNDEEVDGEALGNATVLRLPIHGALVLAPLGGFSYTPQPNFNGRDTFRYRVFDSSGLSSDDEVEVLITSVNDAPDAQNDAYETNQGQQLLVPAASGVLNNDSDVDGPSLSASLIAPPLRGQLQLAANGSFNYQPDPTFTGIDRFQYQIDDGLGAVDAATVTINVRPAGSAIAITANDDFYSFLGPTLSVAAPGVLSNDSVSGAPALNALIAVAPTVGTAVLNPNGSFNYSAPENFNGVVSFTYAARAGTASELALVTLEVRRASNVPPVALGEQFGVLEDALLDSRSSGGLLVNDRDFEGAALSLQLQTQPSHGQLEARPDGEFTYRPAANFAGTDRFSYRVSDGQLSSNSVEAVITVFAQNDAPVAQNDAYATAQGQSLSVNAAAGLLANDSDVDGDSLSVELVDSPLHGQVQVASNGSLIYQPVASFIGLDSFRYAASDQVARGVATVSVRVGIAGNRPPVAMGERFTIDEDARLSSAEVGLLTANDLDPDGDPLSVSLVNGPSNGVLQLDGAQFSYQPAPNWFGSDQFSYTISDGALSAGPVVAEITVRPVNDPPRAVADLLTVIQGQTLTLNAANGLLSNDSDVEGQALSAVLQLSPNHGSAAVGLDGSLVYRASPSFNGRDEFAYRLSDGVATSIGRVAVDVTVAANRRPVAFGEAFAIPEDTVLDTRALASLLANDFDPDGQPLTLRLLSQPARGHLQTLSGGHIIYTPQRDDTGVVGFDYTVSDGELEAVPVRVEITLLALNDPPIAAADLYPLAPQAGALSIAASDGVLRNDVDPDGDQLLVTLLQPPTAGTLSLRLDGGFFYSPLPGPRPLSDRFIYRIADPAGRQAQAPVDILLAGQIPLSDVLFKSGFEQPTQ